MVDVEDDPLVVVRGRGIESVPVHQPTEFIIDDRNALFPARPVVLITGGWQQAYLHIRLIST